MKIVTIIGARPQFVKAAAFSRAIAGKHEEIIIHTGQHFDANMSDIFFEELKIPKPKYNLGISGGCHGEMTGKMLIKIEEVLLKEKPDWVLVYGDTNSTMAGALAAVKLEIPIAHVEAGGRLGSLKNPEEVNRIVTDHVSEILFAPTEDEKKHLSQENLSERTYVTGNIMYDSYRYFINQTWDWSNARIFDFEGKKITIPQQYYYLTCHRQENTFTDEPLYEILYAMNQMDFPTIYPVHPRNKERAQRLCQKFKFTKIILSQPLGYLESIHILSDAEKVVTDSGGLQCEAFFAQKQCITIFDLVAWPQTMIGKRNQLCAAKSEEILRKLKEEQKIDPNYKPFGDGFTAERIIKILENHKNKCVKEDTL